MIETMIETKIQRDNDQDNDRDKDKRLVGHVLVNKDKPWMHIALKNKEKIR